MPLFQPIRSKTETNRDSFRHIAAVLLAGYMYSLRVFNWFSELSVSFVIAIGQSDYSVVGLTTLKRRSLCYM